MKNRILAALLAFDTTSRHSNLAMIDWIADFLAARGVARRARQTALLRPAAIAVHDDGDVPRQRLRRVLFLKKCHKFVPFTAKAASGGFCGIVCGICTVQRPTNRRVIANQ